MAPLPDGLIYDISEELQLIDVQNVTFKYDADGIKILDGVSLHIDGGEFVAVLGHNGSGKSTLAKHLNAILLPTDGKVIVDGMDTADDDKLWDIRSRVGMVFQNPDNQIVATIVEDDVAFAAENLGVPSGQIRKRVDDALEAVGMTKFKSHAPHLLSGGQKQRVAIAGAIAMQPETIVLDEPTAMLDPTGRAEVMKTIMRLNKDFGITVVLITHNMDEAVMADRVVVMDDGKIIIDGAPRQVFSQVELLKSIGLDVPQVTEIAWELKKEGFNIDCDILSVDECVKELYKLCQ